MRHLLRLLFPLLAVTACRSHGSSGEKTPTWTATVPLATPYPIRNGSCGARGQAILIDQGPGLVTIDRSARSVSVGSPPGRPAENSNGPLVLAGSDVLDAESGTRMPAPMLSSGQSDLWTEARDTKTIAYAKTLLPTVDGQPTQIDVYGSHHWSEQVADTVSAMQLSNDGALLALLLRKGGAARLELHGLDGPVASPINLGDSTAQVIAFDEANQRLGVVRTRSDGDSLVIVTTTGNEMTAIPLGRGNAATTGSPEKPEPWVGFQGDVFWMLSSAWRGNRDGGHERSSCYYTHVALASKHITTEREVPQVFGNDPEHTCDVRAMCETSEGGVVLLRHDMLRLTAESWAHPL